MTNVEIFSKGKVAAFNDDVVVYNDRTWIVCDGASDTYNRIYDGKHSGALAAETAAEGALAVEYNGGELADYLADRLSELYRRINPDALTNPKARFATTLICARVMGDKLVVTQIGDSAFRINGEKTYFNNKKIDDLTAQLRAHYIQLTGDIEGSRHFIAPTIREQLTYSNDPDHLLGYGAVNGTKVPEKFIHTFTFKLSDMRTLEIFTDGYFDTPDEISIEAYEKVYDKIEVDDPDKYKTYPSTKSKDDRTILIVRF